MSSPILILTQARCGKFDWLKCVLCLPNGVELLDSIRNLDFEILQLLKDVLCGCAVVPGQPDGGGGGPIGGGDGPVDLYVGCARRLYEAVRAFAFPPGGDVALQAAAVALRTAASASGNATLGNAADTLELMVRLRTGALPRTEEASELVRRFCALQSQIPAITPAASPDVALNPALLALALSIVNNILAGVEISRIRRDCCQTVATEGTGQAGGAGVQSGGGGARPVLTVSPTLAALRRNRPV